MTEFVDPTANVDVEQMVAFEGFDYRLSSGNRGLQIHIQECPACGNSNWKVYLNAETGLGNCFVCGEGFNKYKFIKFARGLKSYGDVCKYLNGIGRIVRHRPKEQYTAKINKDWKLPINRRIERADEIPSYLVDRDINLKLVERFDLRVCDAGFYQYENYEGRQRFVDFSNRVIIPVRDIHGKMVTFQGRDMTGQSEKKYLFPNMLPGTGRYVYNADYALKNKFKRLVLNEGAFDVFATTEAIESDALFREYCAAGSFGKHLSVNADGMDTDDQLADLCILRDHGLEEITILWDGERKAILSAMKAALKLQRFGFIAKVGKLPDEKDPAEVDKRTVLGAIASAKPVSKLDLVRYKLAA